MHIAFVGYTESAFKKLNSDIARPTMVPAWARDMREYQLNNMLIEQFHNEIFTQVCDENNADVYYLTAVIAESFFNSEPLCGVVYPAIEMRGNAHNFALPPQLADDVLKVCEASWYKVVRAEDFTYSVVRLFYADSFDVNGEIEWRECPEAMMHYL